MSSVTRRMRRFLPSVAIPHRAASERPVKIHNNRLFCDPFSASSGAPGDGGKNNKFHVTGCKAQLTGRIVRNIYLPVRKASKAEDYNINIRIKRNKQYKNPESGIRKAGKKGKTILITMCCDSFKRHSQKQRCNEICHLHNPMNTGD